MPQIEARRLPYFRSASCRSRTAWRRRRWPRASAARPPRRPSAGRASAPAARTAGPAGTRHPRGAGLWAALTAPSLPVRPHRPLPRPEGSFSLWATRSPSSVAPRMETLTPHCGQSPSRDGDTPPQRTPQTQQFQPTRLRRLRRLRRLHRLHRLHRGGSCRRLGCWAGARALPRGSPCSSSGRFVTVFPSHLPPPRHPVLHLGRCPWSLGRDVTKPPTWPEVNAEMPAHEADTGRNQGAAQTPTCGWETGTRPGTRRPCQAGPHPTPRASPGGDGKGRVRPQASDRPRPRPAAESEAQGPPGDMRPPAAWATAVPDLVVVRQRLPRPHLLHHQVPQVALRLQVRLEDVLPGGRPDLQRGDAEQQEGRRGAPDLLRGRGREPGVRW